jgi:hypothetical protein
LPLVSATATEISSRASPITVARTAATIASDDQSARVLKDSDSRLDAAATHRGVVQLQALSNTEDPLDERAADDELECGLTCGNATHCLDACRRERARLHGWAGVAPTPDEEACGRDCGPFAPHCVRACAVQRAAARGPPLSEDEEVCGRACGPAAPRCARACVAQRAAARGPPPSDDELACAEECADAAGPDTGPATAPPDCVVPCAAERAAMRAWAAANHTTDEEACARACGIAAPRCVRACADARAAAAAAGRTPPVSRAGGFNRPWAGWSLPPPAAIASGGRRCPPRPCDGEEEGCLDDEAGEDGCGTAAPQRAAVPSHAGPGRGHAAGGLLIPAAAALLLLLRRPPPAL